jgi:hypothetical protein
MGWRWFLNQLSSVAPVCTFFVFTKKLDAIPNDLQRLSTHPSVWLKTRLVDVLLQVF